MKHIFILLLIVIFIEKVCSPSKKQLRFNEKKEFIILQFTDLHFGEGRLKDYSSMLLQEKLIKEAKPDLVVITGDAVSGYAWDSCDENFTQKCWIDWTSPMEKLKVPYA